MAQALNEAKLKQWMRDHGPRLIALSAGICRDRHTAEEVVQEAFIRLWRTPPDAGEVAYASWLRRVVTNLSINALQRTRKPQTLPEFSDDRSMLCENGPGDRGDANDDLDLVREAMDRIEAGKRAILMLRAVEQLSYEQIAEHLDVPVGTVMSRLNRARSALAEEMQTIAAQRRESMKHMKFSEHMRKQA